MKRKVLVVAGIAAVRAAIARILQPAGYAVELSSGTQRTRELLAAGTFDAAIAAPSGLGADGQGLIRELQAVVGRVILLAEDATEASQSPDLFPGAEVLSQPLDRSLLLARLAGLLVPAELGGDTQAAPELFGFDGRTVDLAGRTFLDVDGREVSLTRAEFQLLATFLRKPGRVLSRDQLRDAVAGRGTESYDRSIDMLVARLRRKIEPDPKSPRFVVTVPGEGYRFTQRPQRIELDAKPVPAAGKSADTPVTSYFERRQMTVLACQLVGFGALAAKHDPEDVHTATSRVSQAVEELIKPFRGKLVRAPGDSLLVYFGYPEAYEDDAERAVRSALELVRSVPAVEVGLGFRLSLRIGVATGIMLVGGMDAAQQYTAIGEAVNLALHLRSSAPLDGVVIAASTHELLGRFFDCDEMAPVALDGQNLPVWRVTGEPVTVVGRFDGLRRADMLDLVDRVEQTDLLLRRWLQAKRGTGQVVMITGEPGIGKSRLLAELEHHLSAEPHLCVKYFGLPHQTDASMHSIISELQDFCRFERTDLAPTKIAKLQKALLAAGIEDLRNIGLISDLLSLPSEASRSIAELSPSERKKETFAALLQRIKGLAVRQPLLMIVEDIQWIDPASLELLAQLVERAVALPILMLIASRPGFSTPWLGYAHVTVAELPRLARSDAELLLASVTGGKGLPKDITRRILAPTEGVPLFIEELTKTVLEIGVLREGKDHYELDSGDIHAIPRTLHGSLLARLDRLGPGKEVAQIGAVIGREFSYELLSAVAAMPEVALRTALDRLGASELIYSRGTPPLATYMFKHALVRDAAYGMLLRARRNELHGAIAQALEDRFGELAEAQPELLAHHYTEADNAAKAVRYLSIAGERALSRSALDEAYRHTTRALELIPRLVDDDARRRDELKLRIALARTLLEQKGYADIEVGDAYMIAARLSTRVDDPALYLAVHYGLWAHHYIGGKPKAMLVQAGEFLDFAEQQGQSGPIVTGHRLVGTAHLINGHVETASAALDEALARYLPIEHGAASRVGRDLRSRFGQDVGVTVHSYRSWARWLSGWPDQAADAAAKAEQFGRESGHMHSLFYALWHAGMANVLLRNQSEVGRLGSELTRHANERELPYWQALGHFLEGWHAGHCGRPADAVARLRLGLELWEQRGSRVFRPVCMAFLAEAYFADDQTELAKTTFEAALQIGSETGERWAEPEILRLQAELLAGKKDHPPKFAITRLEKAIELARQQGSRSLELRATMSLARILARKGKPSQMLERLSNIYQTFGEGFGTADLIEAKSMLTTTTVQ
jgi:DNA-binding response OmpR family regulator/class 3 adenylate cyclase/predicted ATPase/ABC-type cobalamin transport system ATPase subunit